MNNNTRRRLERRRQQRRERLRDSRVPTPPVQPGSCPLCLTRPGVVEAEVNASEGSERVVTLLMCVECSAAVKVGAWLRQHGFDELRRRIGA
jgi:hypothetical protein